MLILIPRRNHITPVLRELHWLKIHDRIIFKILTHKTVNNTAPEYLRDLIMFNVMVRLFVHVHSLILVYYVFPQLVKGFSFDALKKESTHISI